MRALLISTYELGRQPFGLASPAAWLRAAGHHVDCTDLAVESLDEQAVRDADLVGFYLPMHTATRIAQSVIPRVRRLAPGARLAAWGLYAPIAGPELRAAGVEVLIGGEFERRLVEALGTPGASESVSLERLDFLPPDRGSLPPLDRYARLRLPDGRERRVGATEASRGCRHLCRHCPVVPVYEGRFRVVPEDIVLGDVSDLVERGAEHITFGDPDFLNGPRHAERLVRALHARFPALSYDVTVKVEHLLRHRELLPLLRDTGCALITSAVESLDDRVLEILDKGHTREDFVRALELCREHDLALQPTFVPFHPWTTLAGYRELLRTLVELDLVGAVSPIQLAIRLLVPRGSRLLELPEVRDAVGDYDEALLSFGWRHPDPRVDALQVEVERLVAESGHQESGRAAVFGAIWSATERIDACDLARKAAVPGGLPELPDRATVPYLTEPWYC